MAKKTVSQTTPQNASIATLEDFQNSPDEVIVKIPADELKPGMIVRVKLPDSLQQENLADADYAYAPDGRRQPVPGSHARWTIACVVDADGKRIFKPEHADWLQKKCGRLLSRVYWAAQTASFATDMKVEEEVKNSETDHA